MIRRIAENRRVSFGVAAHIYACKPIAVRQRMCKEQEIRQMAAKLHMDGRVVRR